MSGSTAAGVPQYVATIVLVSGVVGGLLVIIAVILFCKYCVHDDSPCVRRRSQHCNMPPSACQAQHEFSISPLTQSTA